MTQEKQLYNCRDMARRVGVSVVTLRYWRDHKRLPFIRLRRRAMYDPSAVEQWLAANRQTKTTSTEGTTDADPR
ncbi:MAG: helix-turn-helix domain-containing protein [Pirellulaceae bacterium]|nr:helix-turn-helix domain-containing protein [Pirellulaceae bacterium]